MSSSVWISGESPPCTHRNCWFIRAARGRQSNASMQESYTCSEYLILPGGGWRGGKIFQDMRQRKCLSVFWHALNCHPLCKRTVSPCHLECDCYMSHTNTRQQEMKRTNKHNKITLHGQIWRTLSSKSFKQYCTVPLKHHLVHLGVKALTCRIFT